MLVRKINVFYTAFLGASMDRSTIKRRPARGYIFRYEIPQPSAALPRVPTPTYIALLLPLDLLEITTGKKLDHQI